MQFRCLCTESMQRTLESTESGKDASKQAHDHTLPYTHLHPDGCLNRARDNTRGSFPAERLYHEKQPLFLSFVGETEILGWNLVDRKEWQPVLTLIPQPTTKDALLQLSCTKGHCCASTGSMVGCIPLYKGGSCASEEILFLAPVCSC